MTQVHGRRAAQQVASQDQYSRVVTPRIQSEPQLPKQEVKNAKTDQPKPLDTWTNPETGDVHKKLSSKTDKNGYSVSISADPIDKPSFYVLA